MEVPTLLRLPSKINPNQPVRHESSRIMLKSPMIGSTALFMKHRAFQTGGNEVAATDGRNVWFWPRYYTYTASERIGILLHEYLHGGFAHPVRGERMRRRLGKLYSHECFNIAADAIINKAITAQFGKGPRTHNEINIPLDGIDIEKIKKQAEAIVALTRADVDVKRLGDISKLSVEMLYGMLMKLREAAQTHSSEPPPESQEKDERSQREREQNESSMRDYLGMFDMPTDIQIIDMSNMTEADLNEVIRTAGERIKTARSMYGNGTHGMLEMLEGDIPTVNTPWESSFRHLTQKYLSRERQVNKRRPGRRVLTQKALELERIVWSPGRKRMPVPRVAVIMDSSGSILPEDYMKYLGEVQAMKRRTNADVTVIVADVEIQSVKHIKDVKDIPHIEFKGRGGTDFRPSLAWVEENEFDLAIYLTDLVGTFPESLDIPVIWAVNASEVPAGYTPPFGRVILLGQ